MVNVNINNIKKARVLYTDVLRVLAIISVVALHVSSSLLYSVSVNSPGWMAADIVNSLSRFCVPVFLMVSGVFLLDSERPFNLYRFYGKNVFRLIIAYVFWGILYAKLTQLDGDWISIIGSVVLGRPNYHLYFLLYMLGLYIAVPVLRIFTNGASQADYIYFLVMWFVFASLLPFASQFVHLFIPGRYSQIFTGIPGGMDMKFFTNYTGFMIMGQYFHKFFLSKKIAGFIYILALLGGFFTITVTAWISKKSGILNEMFYMYNQPNIVFISAGMFLFIKNTAKKIETFKILTHVIFMLSSCSFGVYLCHDIFLWIFTRPPYQLLIKLADHSYIFILVISAVVIILSFGAVMTWKLFSNRFSYIVTNIKIKN